MRLRLWILLIIIGTVSVGIGAFALSTPKRERKGEIQGVGTVRHLSFEGGFWGIVSDNGTSYDVSVVPPEFQIDGLRVRFSVNVAHDAISFHMWGQVAELVSIEGL